MTLFPRTSTLNPTCERCLNWPATAREEVAKLRAAAPKQEPTLEARCTQLVVGLDLETGHDFGCAQYTPTQEATGL